ncbi:MAG: hypothetical protein ACO29O_03860 [Chitinophagaceae bacterium]
MTFRHFSRLWIHTHVLTAFYAACMTWYAVDLHASNNTALIFFIFWSTLCSYNFHKWINLIFEKVHLRDAWDHQHRNVFLILTLFSMCMIAINIEIIIQHFYLFLIAVFSTLLYTLPNLPFKPFKWLRNIATAKTLFLAAVWTYVTVFIPFDIHIKYWASSDFIFLIQRLSFIYAICILFDERDKGEDIIKGIRSISTMTNPHWTAFMYYLSTSISLVCCFLLYPKNQLMAIPTVIPSLIALFLFNRYKGKSTIYYTVFLDGLMALPAGIYFISQIGLFSH